ncbi:unnamed protein product [Toxocara canis]|uniref:Non-structural maintenance of chromosomes element 1 homolog n=1 Tax=Toxocara canis TaxID=6265 RepID=A0A183V515_TOXCA|nr:unnamed protein product [Toxocara canis]
METLSTIVKNYSEIHRHLVRYLMHKGYTQTGDFCGKLVTFIECYGNPSERQKEKLHSLSKKETRSVLIGMLHCLNENLNVFGIRVVEITDEHDEDTDYITLVNSRPFSETLQGVSGWKRGEVALFNEWLGMICSSEDGQFSKTEAIGVASDFFNTASQKRAQRLLDELLADKWLCMGQDGERIRLSARALAELEVGLVNKFSLETCVQCKRVILMKRRALHCNACDAYLHHHCAARLRRSMRSGNLKCRGDLGRCGAVLEFPAANDHTNNGEAYVNGEEALHMDEVDLETVAGNVADSLSQIFLLTPRAEIRARAYELMGAHSAREFAAHVERRINAYLQLGNEANDNRQTTSESFVHKSQVA